ncbi:hypothetical protein LPW11_19620 [Geomonas sp. RF6]|uniref:hypothetical protein n=1 Tax=Geomonas sp. RF6 TaxID=2897342 RepID=UPI001E446256|nr:hypothetical protein [Geomonas sp. RF6]UFS70075.1 hypothetical protein LPW11_19620 [Geomonas sp. RF6]
MKRALLTFAVLCCTILPVAASAPAHANELALLGGVSDSAEAEKSSYSWQIDYRHRLLKSLSLGMSYLNEGHLSGHHRDGYAPQAWAHLPLLADRLELSAGVGPYLYFDTITAEGSPTGYRNDHGFKALTSLSAAWYSERNWFVQLQGNYLALGGSIDTITALAGVGYRFPSDGRERESSGAPLEIPDNEITVMLGQTIVNSLDSQNSVAAEVELRHRFVPHLEGSISFLFEGDSRLVRRDGLITQLWATDDLFDNRFGIGVGAGAYFDIESYRDLNAERIAGIVTLSGTYRFSCRIDARLSWNRIVTNYDRDSDVIVAGVGYLF